MVILACAFFLLLTPLCEIYAIIGLSFKPYDWRKYFPFFVITIFMISYAFAPNHEMDLTRYFDMVKACGKLSSLKDILTYNNDGLFFRTLVFCLIGKFGDVHLLPAISNSIVYGVMGYITCSCASEYKMEQMIPLVLILQIVLLPFYDVTSNVRNICAFSLIILAAYLDIIKKKHSVGVILLYILPCFIHTSAVVLVIFRLVIFIVKKHKFTIILISFFFPFIINLAYQNLSFFSFGGNIGNVLQTGVEKAYIYWNTEDAMSAYEKALLVSQFEKLNRIYMISFAILIMLAIFFCVKAEDECFNQFSTFIFLICVMTVSCNVFITPHYWRFYCAVVIASPLVLFRLIYNRNGSLLIRRILLSGLVMYLSGGILVNLWKLFNGVNWSEWFSEFLINNPYTILIKIIPNILLYP